MEMFLKFTIAYIMSLRVASLNELSTFQFMPSGGKIMHISEYYVFPKPLDAIL